MVSYTEARSLRSGVDRVESSEASGESAPGLHPPAVAAQSETPGLWRSPHLCLSLHAERSLCVAGSSFPLLGGHSLVGLGTHPVPVDK